MNAYVISCSLKQDPRIEWSVNAMGLLLGQIKSHQCELTGK